VPISASFSTPLKGTGSINFPVWTWNAFMEDCWCWIYLTFLVSGDTFEEAA